MTEFCVHQLYQDYIYMDQYEPLPLPKMEYRKLRRPWGFDILLAGLVFD